MRGWTRIVNDVPAAIERRMETLVSVRNEAMDRVGPGEATDEIDAWVAGKLDDAGFADDVIHRTNGRTPDRGGETAPPDRLAGSEDL